MAKYRLFLHFILSFYLCLQNGSFAFQSLCSAGHIVGYLSSFKTMQAQLVIWLLCIRNHCKAWSWPLNGSASYCKERGLHLFQWPVAAVSVYFCFRLTSSHPWPLSWWIGWEDGEMPRYQRREADGFCGPSGSQGSSDSSASQHGQRWERPAVTGGDFDALQSADKRGAGLGCLLSVLQVFGAGT